MTADRDAPPAPARALFWGAAITLLAAALRLAWVLAVPTVPVSDFAMYRESANYLSELGSLDPGFIYMPGFVVLLAAVKNLGGDLLAQKLVGVVFGALGAAGVYATALALFDAGARGERRGCATAIAAGLVYALWPAGIAMSSVVGTDVPAAALMLVATGCLTGLGARRPVAAALAFGAVMGLAAYLRAVALPLAALGAFYWLATRRSLRASAWLTALSVATALLILSPWAIRNRLREGEFIFTDCHGGITALIGTNPNSEGTYTRALNRLFQTVTGHAVLDEPHKRVDRAAYRLATDWVRFEPAYALGLATLRAERLFDGEQYLLYWPIYRPGVLVPPHDGFFERHRAAITGACNAVGAGLLVAFLAGLALAAAERRARAFVLLPFQAALAATYIAFFAEPRYRIPIEMLAMPVVAHALVGWPRALIAAAASGAGASRRRVGWAAALATLLVGAVVGLAPRAQAAGVELRARHRWAVAVWTVDGQPRVARWRRAPGDGARGGAELLRGAPEGVRLQPPEHEAAVVEVALDGGELPAGDYRLRAAVTATTPATLAIAAPDEVASPSVDVPLPGGAEETVLDGVIHHRGGPFRLIVSTAAGEKKGAGAPAPPPTSIWIGNAAVTRQ